MSPQFRPRFGFARRVATLFALVAASLVVLGVAVSRRVDSMRRSLADLSEVQRETGATMYLLHHTRMLDIHAHKHAADPWDPASPEVEELRFHCDQALATLLEWRSSRRAATNSSLEHSRLESRLNDDLDRGLLELRQSLQAPCARGDALQRIAEVLRAAEVLNEEVHVEESREMRRLLHDATTLRNSVA